MKSYKILFFCLFLSVACQEEKTASDYEPKSQKSFYYDHQTKFRNLINQTKNDAAVNKVLTDYKKFLSSYEVQNNSID